MIDNDHNLFQGQCLDVQRFHCMYQVLPARFGIGADDNRNLPGCILLLHYADRRAVNANAEIRAGLRSVARRPTLVRRPGATRAGRRRSSPDRLSEIWRRSVPSHVVRSISMPSQLAGSCTGTELNRSTAMVFSTFQPSRKALRLLTPCRR